MLQKLADKLVQLAPARYRVAARQFIKFGITGTIGAIVDFGTFNILKHVFGWSAVYTVFGLEIIVANNVSVLLAIVSNFILNKYWTFRDKSKQVARQWMGFLAFNVVTWALNQLLVGVFVQHVPILETLFGSEKDNAAKALAIGIILFLNFFGSKFLIFRKQAPAVVATGPTTPIN